MIQIIEDILLDFKAFSGQSLSYKIMANGKSGRCNIAGKEYIIIWRSEIRKACALNLIAFYKNENVIILSKKIYSTGRELLLENNFNFLEHNGYYRYTLGDFTLFREQKNYYDQRFNELRLNTKTSAKFLLALFLIPKLINYPIQDLANVFNMGKSTVYYYIKQFLKAKYLVLSKEEKVLKFDPTRIEKDEVCKTLFTRSLNKYQLCTLRNNFAKKIRRSSNKSRKMCTFYDELKDINNRPKAAMREFEEGKLVFIVPYNKEVVPELDQLFRKDFTQWYANSALDRICSVK